MELKKAELVPLVNSWNVVAELINGTIDYGVMATYTYDTGDVEETVEALKGIKYIEEEQVEIPLQHFMFKRRDVKKEKIKYCASHIQALLQTKKKRKILMPNIEDVETEDTAIAAKLLAEGKLDKLTAVLCKKEIGLDYGLDLMYEHLEDDADNYTEFIIIRRR
jgi:prephenate dehydratase